MSEYKKAQQDMLRLLQLIDNICEENGIRYSLCGTALVWQHYGFAFETFNPTRCVICVLYEEYLRLIALLRERENEYHICTADFRSQENFDTLSTWVYLADRYILPPERAEDEMFYHTPLIIAPVFYAGNNLCKAKRIEAEIIKTFRILNARAPLPHKSLFSNPKGKWRRTKARIYRSMKQRKNPNLEELIRKLSSSTTGDYLVFRYESGRVSILETHEFQVERVRFESIVTNAFIESERIIQRNYKDFIELGKKGQKVSDLLLCGGEDLRRVQLIQLDMLLEIDRICRKYNLKYNIAFGTLLGAVRHRGFIPWDDDADVNMPYEDYEKLKLVIEDEIDHEKYYFRVQEKEKDCNITYAHLKRNGTIYTKPSREGFSYHPGVYVDIVPIFNGAPNLLLHSIQTRICWFFRTACWAHMGASGERKFFKRQYYQLLARIGNKRAYRLFIKFATICKHKRNKMLFLNGMDRSPYNIAFVKRECYDQPIELEFEGHMFYAPADYEKVLEYCYGKDYMLHPSLWNCHPKQNAKIDLGNIQPEAH